jgi:Flp pilus assembly protein TadG
MFPHHLDDDERGAAAVFVMLMTVALLLGAGLVIDGGYALAERRSLTHRAEQAARVGADALDQASLRDGGTPEVDARRARAAATDFLAGVDVDTATVDIDGPVVSVTIHGHSETAILSIVSLDQIPVTATASAESIDADTP